MKLSYGGLVKEPLLQFVVIGLILFGGERLLNTVDYAEIESTLRHQPKFYSGCLHNHQHSTAARRQTI